MEKLIEAVILFFIVHQCKGVEVTLGNNKEFYGLSSESVFMQCVLSSGNFDQLPQRKWLANGDILISNGVLSSAGSGYMEILGTDRFGLKTPKLNNNFNGTNYICSYGFDQSSLYMRIAEIEGIEQSSGKCINGKSIESCRFSLSRVIPELSSPNFTVSYKDGTMEEITSLLNTTSQMNPDGTYAYQFTVLPTSLSSDVKSISLSFMVDEYSRTLTISTVTDEGDQSSDDHVAEIVGAVGGVIILGIFIFIIFRYKKN